ncbi:nickel pincer cofactor biosynthesis protein LarC [Streptomyces odontomachi]|uniref:nickel pincer cofactor biosynthesis protein LarC n=1 Tax=Streptomyces odontomachi TaxID=2944940 RepID=UPI00210E89BD|nr:nickel pincer cofactor biosynthesis protein LarC [Streptomyces sp. ODS25]
MIGWLSCASGISGDMLLGVLVDVGVPLGVLQEAVDAVAPAPVRLRAERVDRAGIAATRVHVGGTESHTHRHWTDVRDLLSAAPFPGREHALAAFEALAVAEAAVHGTTPESVHFHEVGALDAIADIVGTCAGFAHLGLDELVVSSVAVGGGTVRAAHGVLPVPGPAVVRLLSGRPSHGGPVDVELATPTGATLATTLATGWGSQPAMRVSAQAFGAGGRDLPGQPNVLRLVTGEPSNGSGAPSNGPDGRLMLETNVDDLDPRIWPGVLDALLAAGADDAWLVPVLMKKGRPAQTLRVLAAARVAEAVRQVVFTRTSALGMRSWPVDKHALARRFVTVDVDGCAIAVKVALDTSDQVVNAQPEWDDVAEAARVLGMPEKGVLHRALASFWSAGTQRP